MIIAISVDSTILLTKHSRKPRRLDPFPNLVSRMDTLAIFNGLDVTTAWMASPWTVPVTFCVALSVFLSLLLPCLFPKSEPTGSRLKRRMTSTGLTTLLTETETNRSILFSMMILDKILTRDELATHLRERMASNFFVRFRSKVVGRDFELLEDFDVDNHVHMHDLAEGETAHSYAESLNNAPLDANKPLWAVHVVHENEKTFLMWRMHHCLGDGQSIALFFLKICDNGHELDTAAPVPEPKFKLTKFQTFALFVWSVVVYIRKMLHMFFVNESTQFFKQPGHTSKHLSYSMSLTVDETKAVGKKMKASINDVMLSCVAGALKQILPESEQKQKMFLRTAIPINMRPLNDPFHSTGNAFSSLLINLPIGETNGVKRTKLVVRAMSEAKNSLEKVFTLALTKFMSYLPENVMILMAHHFTSRVSVAITNVRGPAIDLYMVGGKVIQSFGFVPPPPSVNVGIAITSIGNSLGVTVATDKSIEAPKLMRAIEKEFEVLKASVLDEQ